MPQPIKYAIEECWDTQPIVIVKIQEDTEDNYGNNDEPFKHVSQQYQQQRDSYQQYPADMKRA